MTRKEILEKKRKVQEITKAAVSKKDPLSSFPSFHHYNTKDLSVYLDSGRGDNLSSSVKQYIQNLLKVNMEPAYGTEWPEEEKVKRRQMVSSEARYIFVYETVNADANIMFKLSKKGRSNADGTDDKGHLVAFVHYRFTIEEEIPVLYVYELQLEHRVQGKGLGKFLMLLIELIAQKSKMSAVVLTVQKANMTAMNFYRNKLRYLISIMSPSQMGLQSNYEILCKSFNYEAKAVLEMKFLKWNKLQSMLWSRFQFCNFFSVQRSKILFFSLGDVVLSYVWPLVHFHEMHSVILLDR
nr:PREDICTED: N-alpha-acetyltransferase 40-like isoform X1 [Nicotiana tabacum]